MPVFVITRDDLAQIDENHRLYKIKESYDYIDAIKDASFDELQVLDKSWLLKFWCAQKYRKNLDEDDCVSVIDQFTEKYSTFESPYYGLHIVSEDEELARAIYVILQPTVTFPLVIHDSSLEGHKILDDQSRVCSTYRYGSVTVFGTYDVIKPCKLAFTRYEWYEKEERYLSLWLVFTDFLYDKASNPIHAGIRWCSSIFSNI